MRTVRRGLLPGVRIERVRLDESVDRRLRRLGLYLVIADRWRERQRPVIFGLKSWGVVCRHVPAKSSAPARWCWPILPELGELL